MSLTLETLIFFVTSHCNSKCRTCFYWKELNATDDLTIHTAAIHVCSGVARIHPDSLGERPETAMQGNALAQYDVARHLRAF